MIEELEKTESTWSRIPTAGRNRALLQKWKKELKVSTIGRSMYTVSHIEMFFSKR